VGVCAVASIVEPNRSPKYQSIKAKLMRKRAMTTIAKSGYGTFEDGANYVAARLRMTYEVVSFVWGVASTWTVTARSLLKDGRKASEELRDRSYAGYIVSVRQVVDAS
jgi:hypothetical protein